MGQAPIPAAQGIARLRLEEAIEIEALMAHTTLLRQSAGVGKMFAQFAPCLLSPVLNLSLVDLQRVRDIPIAQSVHFFEQERCRLMFRQRLKRAAEAIHEVLTRHGCRLRRARHTPRLLDEPTIVGHEHERPIVILLPAPTPTMAHTVQIGL
jgi:hypothetical protein